MMKTITCFIKQPLKETKKFKFIEEPAFPRKRKQPNYAILEHVDGMVSSASIHHPSTTKEHFSKIYFGAIDTMIRALNDKFEQPSFEAFSTLESLLLKELKGEEHGNEVAWLESRYGDDININALQTEFGVFKTMFGGKHVTHFDDIVSAVQEIGEERLLIANIIIIIQLLLVNASTSATPERYFSLARRF